LRNSLVLVGLSGLAVGFAFMYASLHKPDARVVTSGRLAAASQPASTITATLIASAPPAADEARSAQLFERNRNMPADPDLAAEFEQINLDYFRNILPAGTSVRWETGLSDLGPLIADNFSVLGLTNGSQILLNPSVERDRDQRRRALCHEMVHMAVWRQDQAHGPVFQEQLRHLAELGAFKGIVSTDEERDAMLTTLKQKHLALETEDRSLRRERESLDRTSQAAVDAFNERLRRQTDGAAEYNRLVEQYNLMVSYPDGLARERLNPRADGTLR